MESSQKMASRSKQQLSDRTVVLKLSRTIDPTSVFIDNLFTVAGFAAAEIDSIRDQSTPDGKNSRLLYVLWNKSPTVIEGVVSLLIDLKQEHAAWLLNGVVNPVKVPMSDERHNLLCRKSSELRRFLNPIGGLLDELASMEVFLEIDKDRVRTRPIIDEMADEVTTIMKRKWNAAFDDFIAALNATQQAHVGYILTGRGDERPMSDEHVILLNVNRLLLIDNLTITASGLLSCMIITGAFSENDRQWVRQERTLARTAERFICILLRKSDSAFDKFIFALRESKHEHVANELTKKIVTGRIELNFVEGANQDLIEEQFIERINGTSTFKSVLHKQNISPNASIGSIIIQFRCLTAQAVHVLERKHLSGDLQKLFCDSFAQFLCDKGLILRCFQICASEFDRCRQDFKKSSLMTKRHCTALRNAENRMIIELRNLDEILEILSFDKLIEQHIEELTTRMDRTEAFLNILYRQPDWAYEKFIGALKQTRQRHLVEIIEPSSKMVSELRPTDDKISIKNFKGIYTDILVFVGSSNPLKLKGILRRMQPNHNVLLTINIYRSDQRADCLSTALSVNCPGLMPLEEHVRMIVHRDLANRLISHRYVFRLKTRASSVISWSSTAKELKGKLISVTMKEVQKNERLADPGPQPPIIETSSGRRGMSCMDDDSIFFDYEYEEEDKENTIGVEFRPNREFIRVDRPIAMTPVQEQDDRKEDAAPRKEQPSDEQVPVQSVTSSVSDTSCPPRHFQSKSRTHDDKHALASSVA